MSEDTGRLVGGRYRLGEVLGRGGMGTVWRGKDEILGRTVAVKELRFPQAVDEEEKQRLITRTLREAKAIARIRSGSAITVFDVVDEDDRPWIVMELVEGRSLADHIKKEGTLTPQRAAEVGLAILDVLRAAHREGILHRDVKPSNVLLEEGTGRVVLTDFGIAKVEGDPSVTSTGMLVGAPSYISPERARGKRPGPPADLWSLGGLLYAAVEGQPPYDKGSAISTLTAVMTEPVPASQKAGPLLEAIAGLLVKEPEKRLDVDGARALLDPVAAGTAPDTAAVENTEDEGNARTRVQPAPGDGAGESGAGSHSGSGGRGLGRRRWRSEGGGSGERLRGALKSVRGGAGVGSGAQGSGAAEQSAAGTSEAAADAGTQKAGEQARKPSEWLRKGPGSRRAGAESPAASASSAAAPEKTPKGKGAGATGSRATKSSKASPGATKRAATERGAQAARADGGDAASDTSARSASAKAPAASARSASTAATASTASSVAEGAATTAAGKEVGDTGDGEAAATSVAGSASAESAAGGAATGSPVTGDGSGGRPSPERGGSDAITSLRDLRELPELRKGVSRRVLAVAAAVLVVLVALGAVLFSTLGDGEAGEETSGNGQQGSGSAEQSAAGAGEKEKSDSGAQQGGSDDKDAKQDAKPSPKPSKSALPAGYKQLSDGKFHFSMGMPKEFRRVGVAGQNSGGMYAKAKGALPRIQVDYNASPLDDAAGAWRNLEPAVRGSSSGYHLIGIGQQDWRDYPTVADWQFTRTEDGGKVHVLNRGFKVDGERGYAIMITCKADGWDKDACATLRKTAFATFRPKG